jgi:transformation/transcription domain-associated protein
LQNWIDPKKVSHLNSKTEQIAVASSIIKLFALLPSDAKKFVPGLVTLTIQLEKSWTTEFSSQFREPLTRFLNLYPLETINYFLGKI